MTKTTRKRPAAKQSAEPSEIRFYRSNEKPYGAFSNLYPRPIEFEGRIFPTSEHAYQAGKAQKPAVRSGFSVRQRPRWLPWQLTAFMFGTLCRIGPRSNLIACVLCCGQSSISMLT